MVHFALLNGPHGAVKVDPATTTAEQLSRAIEAAHAGEESEHTAVTVELFAETGEPLCCGPEQVQRSLHALGWPSQGDFRVYGIRRLTQALLQEPEGTADPNEGDSQVFVKLDRTFVVSVSLGKDTVQVLKLKVKAKTGVPVLQQRLMAAGRVLRDESLVLEEAGLKPECNLVVLVGPPPVAMWKSCLGRGANFAAGAYSPMEPQTSDGLSVFFAALYSVASRLSSKRRPAVLAALRRLTAFPPTVSAANEVLSNRTLLPSHRIALVEGLASLFRRIAPPELPGVSIGFGDQSVLEASLQCWAYILTNATDAAAATDIESCWRVVSLSCALTSEPLVDPVLLLVSLDVGLR